MNHFLQIIAGVALLGALGASVLLGYFFLTQTGGGNWIGGLAVAWAIAVFGIALAAFYSVGLAASFVLRGRGDTRFWRWHGWFLAGFLIATAGVFLIQMAVGSWKDHRRSLEEKAAQQNQSVEDDLLADPAKLEAYAAQQGLETALPASSKTPLEGAVERGYDDLAGKFLTQGARVTDSALAFAANRGDLAAVGLLLAHTKILDGKALVAYQGGDSTAFSAIQANQTGPRLPTGQDALKAAFQQGRPDILRLLAEKGVETNGLAADLIWDNKYLRFYPGDTEWKVILAAWQKPSCPKAMQEAIQTETNLGGTTLPSFGEKQVVETLNFTVANSNLADDPAVKHRSKDWPPYNNNSPTIPVFNWGFLRELHPEGAVGPAYSGKGFSMLEFLTQKALDKTGKGGQAILRQAVGIRNVELTQMLVRQGYPLSLLEKETYESSFLDVPDDRAMKAYLKAEGFKFSKEGR